MMERESTMVIRQIDGSIRPGAQGSVLHGYNQRKSTD
jgi:hypothetical protein